MNSYALHWFRRDLRLTANEILDKSATHFKGRVLGVFCFDRVFLARADFSHRRFLFFLNTLEDLRREMRERGGDLIVLDEGPEPAFRKLIQALEKSNLGPPSLVTFNRDYEPFARRRDEHMSEMLIKEFSVNTETGRDHLFIEPSEIHKDGSGPYQVYTPFKNKWLKFFKNEEAERRLKIIERLLKKGPPEFSLKLPKALRAEFIDNDVLLSMLSETEAALPKNFSRSLPEVGFTAAKKVAIHFAKEKIEDYDFSRDIPSIPGTSQISIYLKNGSMTVPILIALLKLNSLEPPKKGASVSSRMKYFQELIWREFYYHILFHFPKVETEAFNAKYRNLNWENREDFFKAWCEGKTGFPIVDAGIRQLNATGWMHNRVRMIVASFLTKDLLIDYRWGEKYFMERLLDGDLAPNNGGWQWAASTGCDPQPYFRIFNPTSQAEKFDPKGDYIRQWVPERKALSNRDIHQPSDDAIVDHAKQRDRALKIFKSARAKD